MKIIRTVIVAASFSLLLACSTSPKTTGYFLPYPIAEVTEATAFYDGGTTVIHFVLEDGSRWGLMINMSLDDKKNPETYKALSISQNNFTEESKIKIREMDIKIGSKEEYEILSLLYEFRQKNHRKMNRNHLHYIDYLLKEKEYLLTRN